MVAVAQQEGRGHAKARVAPEVVVTARAGEPVDGVAAGEDQQADDEQPVGNQAQVRDERERGNGGHY